MTRLSAEQKARIERMLNVERLLAEIEALEKERDEWREKFFKAMAEKLKAEL